MDEQTEKTICYLALENGSLVELEPDHWLYDDPARLPMVQAMKTVYETNSGDLLGYQVYIDELRDDIALALEQGYDLPVVEVYPSDGSVHEATANGVVIFGEHEAGVDAFMRVIVFRERNHVAGVLLCETFPAYLLALQKVLPIWQAVRQTTELRNLR